MNINKTHQIILFLLIIGLLCSVFTLIVPWGILDVEIDTNNNEYIDFYSWSVYSIYNSTESYWTIEHNNPNSYEYLVSLEEIIEYDLPLAFYFVVFPITLLIICLEIITIYYVSKNMKPFYLLFLGGTISIIDIFFFYIFVNYGLFSTSFGNLMKSSFNYSLGYFFMIISAILFYISFFSIKYLEKIV